MPRPPRLCTCGKIVPHHTLCLCQRKAKRARDKRHDRGRLTSRERGYDRSWDVARRVFLDRHPACAFCGNPANVVDHIIPHRGDKTLFWDHANWQPLCGPCHNGTKQRQERQRDA